MQTRSTRTTFKIAFALLAISLSGHCLGCKGSQLGAYRWGGSAIGQGSEDRQKSRAVYFDPYPLNDIGPPVVGGRPHGFMNPLPEANRNELRNPLANPWQNYNR
jgi:hypothetical protein